MCTFECCYYCKHIVTIREGVKVENGPICPEMQRKNFPLGEGGWGEEGSDEGSDEGSEEKSCEN